jgi:hypothetical protein
MEHDVKTQFDRGFRLRTLLARVRNFAISNSPRIAKLQTILPGTGPTGTGTEERTTKKRRREGKIFADELLVLLEHDQQLQTRPNIQEPTFLSHKTINRCTTCQHPAQK